MDVNKLTKKAWYKRPTIETKVGTGAEAVSTGQFSCKADPNKPQLGLQIMAGQTPTVLKCFSVDKLDLTNLKAGDTVRIGNDTGIVTAARLPK